MKSVLLFSGGLDCFLIYKLFGPMDLLYIQHANSYEGAELEAIYNFCDEEGFWPNPDVRLIIDKDSLNLKGFEQQDKIIANRNLLFITIAVNYGYDNIYIGSVLGDNSKDQNEPFFTDVSKLLSNLNNRHITAYAIAKNYTKTDLVRMYLNRGFAVEDLFKSYSCYSGNERPCGRCKPCIRKWVALEHNNIDTSKYFENNPLESEYFKDENLRLIMAQQWRGVREDQEILDVLKKKKYVL